MIYILASLLNDDYALDSWEALVSTLEDEPDEATRKDFYHMYNGCPL